MVDVVLFALAALDAPHLTVKAFLNYLFFSKMQLTATTSRALESQGAASWLQPIMGHVPTQARLTGQPVPRHAEIPGMRRRLPPTSNAQAGMSVYYGMASSPVVPKPHAYSIREKEIV